MSIRNGVIAFGLVLSTSAHAQVKGAATVLPIFDAHVHFSHDAAAQIGTDKVIALMREAGLKRVMVSSSDDEGTQKLFKAAPDLIVPSLRPYRQRGDLSTWTKDPGTIPYLEQRLKRYKYAAIGEFHLYGADADSPIPRRMVELSQQYKLILHAHSDSDAIERLFKQAPQATVLWAHSGFDRPEAVRDMLKKHPRLYADLAYRTDQASPEWTAVFKEFPDRFMVGTDTFTPERLFYIPEHARFSRDWLKALPTNVAEKIGWRNGEALISRFWKTPTDEAIKSSL
jgi:Tat protein secretion system quality control protein TatD with DNase activity